MKKYVVEIVGLVTVDAESPDDAIEQVRDLFYEETLNIDDLHLAVDNESDEE